MNLQNEKRVNTYFWIHSNGATPDSAGLTNASLRSVRELSRRAKQVVLRPFQSAGDIVMLSATTAILEGRVGS